MNIRLLAFLIVLTVLRLVGIGRTELMPDEAQYHEWSQRLDWCYFSKGPGVALAIRASTAIFGHGEFGVRFFAPLLALGTSLLLYWLARRIYDARIATWTVVLANLTPLFNVGGLLMTIDPLSIFFWTAALCTLWLALEKSPAFSRWWPLSGLLIGCGFYAKWTNAVQIVAVVLLLALTPRYRAELRRPGFWSMLAVFAPFLWPIWRWQEEHGWPTTHHLAARGGLETPWWRLDLAEFGKFFLTHFGVYSPLIFAAMLVALWAAIRDSVQRWLSALLRAVPALPVSLRKHPIRVALIVLLAVACFFAGNYFDLPLLHRLAFVVPALAVVAGLASWKQAANIQWKSRFLAAFALPLVLGYAWVALHHDSEVNWTAPAAVSVFILMVAYWLDRIRTPPWRLWSWVAIALGVLMSFAALFSDAVRAAGIPWPLSKDPSARMRGWRQTAQVVHDFRRRVEQQLGQPVFLIAENYGLASELCYYLPEKRIEAPGHPAVYVEESPVPLNQFHFWGRYDEFEPRTAPVTNAEDDSQEYGVNRFAGRAALYITTREESEPPSVLIPSFFQKIDPELPWNKQPEKPWKQFTQFELKEDGQTLRKLRIFVCPRYRPGQVLD